MIRPRLFQFYLVAALATAGFGWPSGQPAVCAQEKLIDGTENRLAIPKRHPRIWWTPQRLTAAKKWLLRNHFVPKANDPWGNALCHILTGESTYARAAIKSLMDFSIAEGPLLKGVASDPYRVNDWFPVVYDWTYDAMSMEERRT